MGKKYKELSPEAREKTKAKALEYYYKNKNNPAYIAVRRAWHKQKAEKNPGFWIGKYQKNPERNREYAKRIRVRGRKPSGTLGTIRYEAKLAGFRSGFERTIDTQLKISGIGYSYESLKIPYTLEGEYNPDFHLVDTNIYVETKGVLSREDRRKMRAVKDQHPEIDIRFLFMREGTRIQHGKMTNEEWATKNGFVYAVEKIPEDWLFV